METAVGVGYSAHRNPAEAGKEAARKALDQAKSRGADSACERLAADIKPFVAEDSIACFLFADGLTLNFDPFLTAFEKTLQRKNFTSVVTAVY